ncbi:MAG TPA: methyl-accepting chemotaxis protein [Gemmatimonadaceae bacterium]|nr:methyl-accepting chemotaxis protein [Gemmatimonadaceae bacterium]
MSRVRQSWSIRARLVAGFGVTLLIMVAAGLVGRHALAAMSETIGRTLDGTQEEARSSAQLAGDIAREVQAGAMYVETGDSTAQAQFHELGFSAHELQARLAALPGRSTPEVSLLARIDDELSDAEVHYARAHRLRDLGRMESARAAGDSARRIVTSVLAGLDQLGEFTARKVAGASESLRADAERRSMLLMALVIAALMAAVLVGMATVRSIDHPLRALVSHARRLSSGELFARVSATMPAEFRILADALDTTAAWLERMVNGVAHGSEEVAASADQYASISQAMSEAANHVAMAMAEISAGAEGQVSQLREVDTELHAVADRTERVTAGAQEVDALATQIAASASTRRADVDQALAVLLDVRSTVRSAADEVDELHRMIGDIHRFAGAVGSVAEQTNLLALNAAIEAARAGDAGRGFGVVAEEIRALAEQARQATLDVVDLTEQIVPRVEATTKAMQGSAARVGEIESVSRQLDATLEAIAQAADGTRRAASVLVEAAGESTSSVARATQAMSAIAATAENHASAAEQVTASSQEQSATSEELSSSCAALLASATRLRELIDGMRGGGAVESGNGTGAEDAQNVASTPATSWPSLLVRAPREVASLS